MIVKFSKFHGAGNDFVMIDNRKGEYDLTEKQLAFLCHRRFGIGADGLMLLNSSANHDFQMRYYNSDGAEGTMCGNGGRCITAFAQFVGLEEERFSFEAIDGIHEAIINYKENNIWDVSLQMIDVKSATQKKDSFFFDTGSPHHIEFVDSLDEVDVVKQGRAIRNNSYYKPNGGTNVNFAVLHDEYIEVRTYERGVEDETLACGTGVTAVAMSAAIRENKTVGDFKLRARGGDLFVRFKREGDLFTDVWLRGPAEFVFNGEIVL